MKVLEKEKWFMNILVAFCNILKTIGKSN